MRFSLWLYPYGRWGGIEAMGDAAVRAEQLGFHNVSVSDHIVCPRGPDEAGVTPVWPDWSVLSTYLATRTSALRILATLVVPYRPVLATAKQIATIDALSGGRFILAAAIGWLEREFEMLRVPHGRRGEITDEYVRAMKALWMEDNPSFSGRYVRFSDLIFEPKCAQSPHVPIWVAGGTGAGPIRRLLELGDGWMPMGGDLDTELRGTIERIREGAADRGRDPDEITFRYTIGIGEAEPALASISKSISPEDVAEAIARFEDAGFTELAINFAGDSGERVMEQLEWFGAEVMPILPSASGS